MNGEAGLQTTLAAPTACAGRGVHSGAPVRVRICPGPIDTGVVFVRTDLAGAEVEARVDRVVDTRLGTTLRGASGAEAATVEHFLAGCFAAGVDNVRVEMDGPEIPIMDGSAAAFAEAIRSVGLFEQAAPRRHLVVARAVEAREGARVARLAPVAAGTPPALDVLIRFEDPAIGVQRFTGPFTTEAVRLAVAPARTFGFLADVDALRASGRGRGASLENTVVVDAGRVLNPEGLRFDDEFARHKALDAVGDLALCGGRLWATYTAEQPGHGLNVALLRALFSDPAAFAWRDHPP